MRTARLILGFAVFAGLALAGVALAWRPAIAPIAAPPRTAFAPEVVARGAELAAIGDCSVCHGAGLGHAYAGGLGLRTPFGTVYVTNITPDPDTGIGRWSEAAFRRAMRDGIGRTGRHLYPALPYPHFTRATDPDIAALYAFLMTRAPVHATTPPNPLPFPLNVRATLAGWNLLFLRPGAWRPDPAQSAEWNHGAYLVDAVGHCGACHSPAQRAGRGGDRPGAGRRRGRGLDGARAELELAGPAALDGGPAARLPPHRPRHRARRRRRADDRGDRRARHGAGRGRAGDRGLRGVAHAAGRPPGPCGPRSPRPGWTTRCSTAPAPPATPPTRR